jgi:hypothetical protein
MEIRDAIREDRCCQVCLLNYRKDGSTFLNQFFLSPIKVRFCMSSLWAALPRLFDPYWVAVGLLLSQGHPAAHI